MKRSVGKRYFLWMGALLTLLAAAGCAQDADGDEETMPDGYGRLELAIGMPETLTATRAVSTTSPWLQGNDEERAIRSYHLLICSGNEIKQALSGTNLALGSHDDGNNRFPSTTRVKSELMAAGTYTFTFYCLANFTDEMLAQAGLTVSGGTVSNTTLPEGFETRVIRPIVNATDTAAVVTAQAGLPMTGKLAGVSVTIANGSTTTIADPLILWRMMAKLDFVFTNRSASRVQVKGIEVEPLNLATAGKGSGVHLISQDDLLSLLNLRPGNSSATQQGVTLPAAARQDVGTVRYQPAATPLTLAAKSDGDDDEGHIAFYVNESDATYTTTDNQYSLRFKIARETATPGVWLDDEIRYAFTTAHDGSAGGFNVIRRNDWIHIPVSLTDWQLRLEAMPFVPIAGYPAVLVSSDGLNATFSTGGYIILQPFLKRNSDVAWRDFTDPEVQLVSIHWKNSDGTDQAGNTMILKTPFAYNPVNGCITGELNNDLAGTDPRMTTLTITVKLGPSTEQYTYVYTCNVVLDK